MEAAESSETSLPT